MRCLWSLFWGIWCLSLTGCGDSRPLAGTGAGTGAGADAAWVGAWMTAQGFADIQGFTDQSLRLIVHPHYGGSMLRLRFAHHYGASPVTLRSVHIGQRDRDAAVVPGSQVSAHFNGADTVVLSPGDEVLSDPLRFEMAPFKDVAISFYIAGDGGPPSAHGEALQTTYVTASGAGDHAADESARAFTATTVHWHYLTGIDVLVPAGTSSVVMLGDSITDGSGSIYGIAKPGDDHFGRNGRWPDALARRLMATSSSAPLSVLNAGIGANRLLTDAPFGTYDPVFAAGDSALTRLERDVLDVPGVCTVVVLIGTNDIGIPVLNRPPLSPTVSADDMIAGYREIIRRAHQRGLRVLGGTLLPANFLFHGEPLGTGIRESINDWVRNSGEYDGVIDFDAALRDPAYPQQLRPEYDSGDGLHPSLAGYEAMAQAVNLEELHCRPVARP